LWCDGDGLIAHITRFSANELVDFIVFEVAQGTSFIFSGVPDDGAFAVILIDVNVAVALRVADDELVIAGVDTVDFIWKMNWAILSVTGFRCGCGVDVISPVQSE
jgi:hypothetical protein